MQAVVLAGGLATRMHPSTLKVPKSMLSVADRPFIDWQLERLAAAGLSEVIMCVAFLGDQIREHVEDGARFGLAVRWSYEGATLLGTAGALRMALPFLDATFLVTYGDSYLPFDYGGPLRMLNASTDADGVMSVFKNEGKWDASNVSTDGGWVTRYEKGVRDPMLDHIDYGATALRRDVVAALPEGMPMGLDAVQTEIAKRQRLRAYLAHERFYEVGSPEGLAELDRYLRTTASL